MAQGFFFKFVLIFTYSQVNYFSFLDVFRHRTSHSRFDVTLQGLEKKKISTSKNVTFFLELGTNVTILSLAHRHIIFLGWAWNKPGFETLARSWVLGAGFLDFG